MRHNHTSSPETPCPTRTSCPDRGTPFTTPHAARDRRPTGKPPLRSSSDGLPEPDPGSTAFKPPNTSARTSRAAGTRPDRPTPATGSAQSGRESRRATVHQSHHDTFAEDTAFAETEGEPPVGLCEPDPAKPLSDKEFGQSEEESCRTAPAVDPAVAQVEGEPTGAFDRKADHATPVTHPADHLPVPPANPVIPHQRRPFGGPW
ncbi:hypothetical protein [Actinosynnema sp. NPDC020468]|uniref:hypothetical protein n=1 Tax=Actinosynnema sp. NPDC020468 TaxID=3154488 RepID=UPI0033D3C070